MDFTGQFRLDDDSMHIFQCATPQKLIQDPEPNPNSQTQTVKKCFELKLTSEDTIPRRLIFDSPRTGKRWSLKYISGRIMDELKLKSISYSEISAKLTEEMVAEFADDPLEKQKEIQNLRRRVYDAINVMISLGLVVKNKKLLIKAKDPQFNVLKGNLINRKQKLKQQLKQKTQSANNLIEKEKCLKKLIEINKSRTAYDSLKVYFPFLFVKTTLQNFADDELLLEYGQDQLVVMSKHPLIVKGDVDVVLKLFEHKSIL